MASLRASPATAARANSRPTSDRFEEKKKPMRYRLLGRSGLRVSELCLGTMTFGKDWGWGAPLEDCTQMFHAYVEAGGNFIDTANRYTDGTSEKIVGELVDGRRDRFVIATKYSLSTREGDPNAGGNHRKNLTQSLDASLKRLRTEYVDLYWVHAWDFTTPIDEVMRALDDAVSAGKVLHVGMSDAPAWVVAQANTLATLRGWSPFVGVQIQYNLIERTVERELIPMARAFELAIVAWSPLAFGILTGKYGAGSAPAEDGMRGSLLADRLTPRALTIVAEAQAIAAELGHTVSQIALAWVRSRGLDVIPIVGARTPAQLAENLKALDFVLPAEALARLDAATAIELGFPHDFINEDSLAGFVYGIPGSQLERVQIRAPQPRP
jgi:aryl-alcohol dehydrogenase-like predicted oxidoreductase